MRPGGPHDGTDWETEGLPEPSPSIRFVPVLVVAPSCGLLYTCEIRVNGRVVARTQGSHLPMSCPSTRAAQPTLTFPFFSIGSNSDGELIDIGYLLLATGSAPRMPNPALRRGGKLDDHHPYYRAPTSLRCHRSVEHGVPICQVTKGVLTEAGRYPPSNRHLVSGY